MTPSIQSIHSYACIGNLLVSTLLSTFRPSPTRTVKLHREYIGTAYYKSEKFGVSPHLPLMVTWQIHMSSPPSVLGSNLQPLGSVRTSEHKASTKPTICNNHTNFRTPSIQYPIRNTIQYRAQYPILCTIEQPSTRSQVSGLRYQDSSKVPCIKYRVL